MSSLVHSKPTLATLAKRKLEQSDANKTAPGGGQQRGRWIFHSGEDTIDESLEIYYCAFCGTHSLILDQLISELPTRSSDQARVVAFSKHAVKLILDEGPCVKIKRTPTLLEKQYRYLCKGCGLYLAYVSYPFNDQTNNKYLYLVDGAFSLTNTGKTKVQLEAEQSEKELPIVIPKFNVQKAATPAETTTSTAAANSTPTTATASSTTKPETTASETAAPKSDV